MSDNPTRSFKDFIGWAFLGLAGVVLALVSMIYSSLSADVGRVDARTQAHAERLKGGESERDAIREALKRIEEDVRWLKQMKIKELERK